MLPRKPWHFLYAVLLISVSVVCTSTLANTRVYKLVSELVSTTGFNGTLADTELTENRGISEIGSGSATKTEEVVSASRTMSTSLFATIITNSDDTITCDNGGTSISTYSLCGDFDDRPVLLQGSYSSYQWEQFVPKAGCTFDVNNACANTTLSCWSEISTSPNFNIDASTISASLGAGFRVRVNGTGPYYYFNVKKSTIPQTYVKRDFICGVPGRIQITNLSSAYEYSINDGTGFGPYQGAIFDNLLPGTYTVKARLKNTSNTCEYLYEPIEIEQRDISIDVSFVDAQCSGEFGSISVTANNVPGPFKYTLVNSDGTSQEFTSFITPSNYVFSAVGFGTYSVRVETQQCKGDPINGIPAPSQDVDINGDPIIIGEGIVALEASTEVNNSFGCGIPSVDITVRTSGGTAPYTYIVNGSGPSSGPFTGSATHTVTAPGDYDFLITDSNGCTIPAFAEVKELTPPDVTVSGTDGDCTNGGAKINFNVVDAKGYNLSFRATPSDPWSTNIPLSVPAGTYGSIQVRYQQGDFECIYDVPTAVTVTTTGVIMGTAVKISDQICNGSGGTTGGSIEFQGPFSGGSGSGYVFSIWGDDPANFSTQTLYTGLEPGTYTSVIRDDGGCRSEFSITIDDIDPPTAITFAQGNVNCGAGTADVQLSVTSNFAIASYEVVSPISLDNGGSDTFIGLSTATSYQFRVTDINGCSYTAGYTPNAISSIRVRLRAGADTRVCTGATDGTGTFIVDGFGNTFTYNINSGTESAAQSGSEVVLPPSGTGTHTITVTDTDTGCTDTASVTITEPSAPIDLLGTVTAMSCANNNLGRVVGNASGGWGSYRYTLEYPNGTEVGPTSNASFGNLSAPGTYTLSVADSEGCADTFDFTLTALSSPDIALDAATDYCYVPGVGATVVVNTTGGLPAYQYRINGGSLQATPSFSGLAPGNYTIEVVDANNCRDQISVTINPQVRALTTIASEIPCGGGNGGIRVVVNNGYISSGGTKQYQVNLDGADIGTPIPLASNDFIYSTDVPGIYVFKVTDNRGCETESSPFVLSPAESIEAMAQVTPASCGQTNNGIVTIVPDATVGVPPYTISFNGGPFTPQTTYSNLNAGQTYPYIVRDARGCETNGNTVTIPTDSTPPPNTNVIPVDATCTTGVLAGEIQINGVADGTPDFTYILQDQYGNELERLGPTASTSETFIGLATGIYTVVTVDALGCRDEDTVEVEQTTLYVVPDPVPAPVCSATGFTNTVEIFGGTGLYQIRLVAVPENTFESPNAGPTRHTFNGLLYGVSYTVEVLDLGTGCTYLEVIDPVTGPSPLDVDAVSTPGFCDADRNGEITYTVTGFTGSRIRISIIDSDTGEIIFTNTFNGVPTPFINTYLDLPGNYQVVATDLDDNNCTAGAAITIDQNLPSIDILQENPANCNSDGQFTVQGSGGAGGPYEFAYVPAGTAPDYDGTATTGDTSDDFSPATTAFRPEGNYDIYVRDIKGCVSFGIGQIVRSEPVLPAPEITVVNQCDINAAQFEITATVPGWVDTPRFTLNGEIIIGSPAVFYVSTPGIYTVDVVDANGCSSSNTGEVFEFIYASGDFDVIPNCEASDGTIVVEADGGSNDYTYQLQDDLGNDIGAPIVGDGDAGIFTNIGPGSYQVLVTDNVVNDGTVFCDFTVTGIKREAPTLPVIDNVAKQDISCFGVNNGSLSVSLASGTDMDGPITYNLLDFNTRQVLASNSSGSFANLGAIEFYEVEVVTSRNCRVLSGPQRFVAPADFAITATAPDFTCETDANRYSSTTITVTVDPSNPGTVGTGYQYSITGFNNYQSSNEFEIVDNGSPQDITIYAIDGNGCQTSFVLPTINPPLDVVPTLSVLSVLDCQDPERVRIEVVGTTNFTVSTTSVVPIADVNVNGATFVDIDLPADGDYFFEITDNDPDGCTYPLPMHTVVEPISPQVSISEAKSVQCYGANDGALNIEVSDYIGNYTYNVYRSTDVTASTPIATGSLNTANNPEIIENLPGGSLYVVIDSDGAPFCSDSSNIATIGTPYGALTVTAVELGNVSCNDNTGQIEATGSGGWDTSAYEYALALETPLDSNNFVEVYAYDDENVFTGLSSGRYRVYVRDKEGCESSRDRLLEPVDPILAGIREPQELVCPGANNAELEAYDPTSGDIFTALPGASGGVSGAGYKYRLLRLDSNDINDIKDDGYGGLQDDPTFTGISTGWYAIEVSSSFECIGYTLPYYVESPPTIIPRLVQVQAPGCGGQGLMRLSVENPEAGFVYEYRAYNADISDPYIEMADTWVLIDGGPDLFYQFDIRKKDVSGINICSSVLSPGINLVDAEVVELVPNLINDISCASELDGRIESFAAGGVGNYQFTLYLGDPIDPFSPDAGATVVRPAQSDGTFEGLPEGEYYIGVTSGVSCGDIVGPLPILRPEVIEFESIASPISCNGQADGTISLEVTAGGVGLIQFAISPNFNEFFSNPDTPGQYVFENLDPGTYEILIQDENGCSEKEVLTIVEPAVLEVSSVETPETCINAMDGTAQLTITGGTPFVDPVTLETYYETSLNSSGDADFVRNDALFFENLVGGETYVVFVRDSEGCATNVIVPIIIGVDLTGTAVPEYGCEGIFPNSTVTLEMADSSVVPGLLYSLDVDDISLANTTRTFGDLAPGPHTIYMYHENGCSNSVDFTIDAYEPLVLEAIKTGPNEITAMATGGFGDYQYYFEGQATGANNVFTLNMDTTVTIRVVDGNGCMVTITIPFDFTGTFDPPNFFTPDGDNMNEVWDPDNSNYFPNLEVKIYDRYGRVVAILDNVKGWDGKYEGNELPTGDYWYVVNANDEDKQQFVGHFTLYR